MLNNFHDLLPYLTDEDKARELFERLRWPNGPVCPHCKATDKLYTVKSKKARKGVYKCGHCKKQFSATVGTVMHGSRIPLSKWILAIYHMCSSKKGVSANQLSRELGITYKSAWFMCHRVRYAMTEPPLMDKLKGVVEVDETYIGPNPRNNFHKEWRARYRYLEPQKTIVMTLIQRDGDVYTTVPPNTWKTTMQNVIRLIVDKDSEIITDGHPSYKGLDKHFKSHKSIDHSKEFVRGTIHTNFAESYHSLLKRGLFGTFHHVSRKHLPRYLKEFEFRWNSRHDTDINRMALAVLGTGNKRITLRKSIKKGA